MKHRRVPPWNENKAEVRFRELAFHVAYHCLYDDVRDASLRFLYALQHSIKPIRNRAVLDAWWKFTKGKTLKSALDAGRRVPALLAPVLEAYETAMRKRAEETGDDYDELVGAAA